ncbi:MAG TPA: hypothetical protein VH589_22190 [Trebonia sp.]
MDGMLNLMLIFAALTGLPALTATGRLVMGILMRLIGLGFAMGVVLLILILLATHGKIL